MCDHYLAGSKERLDTRPSPQGVFEKCASSPDLVSFLEACVLSEHPHLLLDCTEDRLGVEHHGGDQSTHLGKMLLGVRSGASVELRERTSTTGPWFCTTMNGRRVAKAVDQYPNHLHG